MKDRLGRGQEAQISQLRPHGGQGVQLDLRKLIIAFRRRTGLFFAVLAATVVVAIIATFLREPLYQAHAEVVLGGESDIAAISSIRSVAMAAKVASALHLAADPKFASGRGIPQRLQSLFGNPEPRATGPVAIARVADRLRRNISVVRPANTLAITISYTATDAKTAARIANAYALAYIGSSPAAIASASRESFDGRIISSAAVPLVSISPEPVFGLIIGIVIGSVFGLAAAVLREMRFAGLTSAADVRDRLWLPHLGSVPTLASVLPNARSATDAVIDFPNSAFAEAFRSLWIAIQGNGSERRQVIAIASALPGEGKTTVAVGLARTLALRGEQVVLVDGAATRNAGGSFGSAVAATGLDDVLSGSAMLDDALVLDDRSGAFLLPNTGSSQTMTDLFDGPAMDRLIDDLRTRFRYVLIATGPLVTSAAARNVAVMADALVIVVRWRATSDRVIANTLKQLRAQSVRIAGAVLSQVDMHKQVRYSVDEATIYQQQFSKYYS